MPIYSYLCDSCGFAKDVLQKMHDAPLIECPECKARAMKKQVTSAGFHLKGSGWYKTDFRNSGAAPSKGTQTSGASEGESAGESAGDKASGEAGGKSEEKPADKVEKTGKADKSDSDKRLSSATASAAGTGSSSPPASAAKSA
jgi:putative FmdB family regulatory protein